MVGIAKWEAHVDWVTLTMKGDASESDKLVWAKNIRGLEQRSGGPTDSRRVQRLGYFGSQTGSVFAGTRYDGSMVIVSGSEADGAAASRWPAAARCTRVDLCVTCWYSESLPGLAKAVAREVAAAREQERTGHARRITLVDGYGNGDTLYIGSRQSDQFARLYDKEKESGQPEYINAWRWEVEYKGKASRQIWSALQQSNLRTDAVAATVEVWFTQRGASRGPGVATLGAVRVECPRPETTDSAKLTWLTRSVAPTVKRLLTTVGYDATVEALGLQDSSE